MDITAPALGKTPDAVVIVATVRALKYNGGQKLADLKTEDLAALESGFANLKRHIHNMKRYGVPVIVGINQFTSDTPAEINRLVELCEQEGTTAIPADVWGKGGQGGLALADALLAVLKQPADFRPLYANTDAVKDKINTIVTQIYGGASVDYDHKAELALRTITKNGWSDLPICMAKTQYSFSDNAKALGAPSGFTINVRDVTPRLGAGFLVVMTGTVLTMPGLPKQPAALNMDVSDDGVISGLF